MVGSNIAVGNFLRSTQLSDAPAVAITVFEMIALVFGGLDGRKGRLETLLANYLAVEKPLVPAIQVLDGGIEGSGTARPRHIPIQRVREFAAPVLIA
jgi:hypothetical protein